MNLLGSIDLDNLCVSHLRELAKLSVAKMSKPSLWTMGIEDRTDRTRIPQSANVTGPPETTNSRRRARSLSDITRPEVVKRPRLDKSDLSMHHETAKPSDEECRRQVLAELKQRSVPSSHSEETDRLITAILQVSRQPNTDKTVGKIEVLFLPGDEAGTLLESGAVEVPIVTDRQQHFRWSGRYTPIAELFRRMVDLKRTVSVQIPSREATIRSFESRTLAEIRKRICHELNQGNRGGTSRVRE